MPEHRRRVPAGGNYKTVHARIAKLGLDTSHFTGASCNVGPRYLSFGRKATLEKILVANSPYAFTHGLQGRLLKEGWKKHQCEECELDQCNGADSSLRLNSII